MRWEEYEGKGALPGVVVWLESDYDRKKAATAKGEYEFPGLFPGITVYGWTCPASSAEVNRSL